MALAKIGQMTESKIYMSKFEELSARSEHIAQIRRLLDEQPHSSRLRVELATHYLHLNKILEAEAQYHIILDRDSLHIEALVKLTQISIQNKQLETINGRKVLHVLNQSNKKLMISIRCETEELDVRIPGRKWSGWEPGKEKFEKSLINDVCKQF